MNKTIEERIKGVYSLSYVDHRFKNKTDFKNGIVIGSSIYGEITREGVDTVVNHFKSHFNENTVFYDLGSGYSKMVLHIGIQYGVKKSVGIEYSKERHEGAMYLKEKYASDLKNINVICGDIMKQDLSDATVVYLDNTALPNELSKKIYDLLPKGCLYLFKSPSFLIGVTKYEMDMDLVDRTYKQKTLCWLIKE